MKSFFTDKRIGESIFKMEHFDATNSRQKHVHATLTAGPMLPMGAIAISIDGRAERFGWTVCPCKLEDTDQVGLIVYTD